MNDIDIFKAFEMHTSYGRNIPPEWAQIQGLAMGRSMRDAGATIAHLRESKLRWTPEHVTIRMPKHHRAMTSENDIVARIRKHDSPEMITLAIELVASAVRRRLLIESMPRGAIHCITPFKRAIEIGDYDITEMLRRNGENKAVTNVDGKILATKFSSAIIDITMNLGPNTRLRHKDGATRIIITEIIPATVLQSLPGMPLEDVIKHPWLENSGHTIESISGKTTTTLWLTTKWTYIIP